MLRTYAGVFLAVAGLLVSLLLAALAHDFGRPEAGWLTSHPTLAGVLIVSAYCSMLLYQVGSRSEAEE